LITQFDSDEEELDVLFFVRPDKLSADSRSVIRAEIPTKHLKGIVALSVAQIDTAQQSLFFSHISSHPWTKGTACWMYEKFVHIRLASPTAPSLMCVPADSASATLMIPVCDITHPLNGKTGLSEANKYSLPFYWRPTSTSFTSIDGIICTNSDIILVQTTVSSQHDVKVLGLDAIRNSLPIGFHQERNFCLVFITPTKESAQDLCNQNMDLPEHWQNLVIYSSTFMIGKLNDVDQDALMTYIEVSCVLFPFLCLIDNLHRRTTKKMTTTKNMWEMNLMKMMSLSSDHSITGMHEFSGALAKGKGKAVSWPLQGRSGTLIFKG
jgi:hypothetical protein